MHSHQLKIRWSQHRLESPNQIRLWDDALTNRLVLEIEKHFGINYNTNKMCEAVRFVARQYLISPPKQYLERLEWNGATSAIGKLLPTFSAQKTQN